MPGRLEPAVAKLPAIAVVEANDTVDRGPRAYRSESGEPKDDAKYLEPQSSPAVIQGGPVDGRADKITDDDLCCKALHTLV